MTEYSAIAARDGDLWVVTIPGIGVTQGTDKQDAVHMARDYIATLREIPIEDVTVRVVFPSSVDPDPWDGMVDAAMEIIRRDSGYPSIADMDRDMPVWREQCEEIATAMLTILLGLVESPLEDDGRRCPRCNPDNTCTLWCLDATIAERTPDMIRELFALRRERDDLSAALSISEGNDLVDKYTGLLAEFNALRGERCGVFTCDHLASVHGDLGCEFCSCSNFMRRAPK